MVERTILSRPDLTQEIVRFIGLADPDHPALGAIVRAAIDDLERMTMQGIGRSRVVLTIRPPLRSLIVPLPYSPVHELYSLYSVDESGVETEIWTHQSGIEPPVRVLAGPVSSLDLGPTWIGGVRVVYEGGWEQPPGELIDELLRMCIARWETRSVRVMPQVIAVPGCGWVWL